MVRKLAIGGACGALLLASAAAATITVCATGCKTDNLNTAIENAQPGDTIVLKAGEVYKGNFSLPWREGSEYITIQSSRVSELPPLGYRVTPAHKPLMATIEQQLRGVAVLQAGAGVSGVTAVDLAGNRLVLEYNFLKNGEEVACWAPDMPPPLVRGKVYYVRDSQQQTIRLAETPGGNPVHFAANAAARQLSCSQAKTAHHYRFRGIEFVSAEGAPSEYTLVSIGSGAEALRAAVPHDFEFIQVYIHGRPSRTAPNEGPRNCLVLNAAHAMIRDSYISECKRSGEESKGILAWQAPGPLIIKNNYIEAGSIDLLLGGAATAIPGLVVGDGDGSGKGGGVVIEGNHFTRQLYWKYEAGAGHNGIPTGACPEGGYAMDVLTGQLYWCQGTWVSHPPCADGEYFRQTNVSQNCASGACWECRNGAFVRIPAPYRGESYVPKALLETKSIMHGVITGNVLEQNWSTAAGVPMQVLNTGYNWNRGENVLFSNNLVRDTSSGYHNGSEGHGFSKPNRGVRVINNLFHHIALTRTPTLIRPDGRSTMFQGPCVDCVFEHNTMLSGIRGGAGLMFSGVPLTGMRFANNIFDANQGGIWGEHGNGCDAIEYYTGKKTFQNNILINNTGALDNGSVGGCALKTYYVSASTELFMGAGNYRLKPTSPYSAACRRKCGFAATDGKDLGADIDEIEAATSGAVAGTPTWAEQMKLTVQPAARQAVVVYEAPDDQACTLRLYTNAARTALDPDTATESAQSDERGANQNAGRTRRFHLGTMAPLAPHTEYWYVLQCRERKIPGYFRTLDK
jgi:hypothetical protein